MIFARWLIFAILKLGYFNHTFDSATPTETLSVMMTTFLPTTAMTVRSSAATSEILVRNMLITQSVVTIRALSVANMFYSVLQTMLSP